MPLHIPAPNGLNTSTAASKLTDMDALALFNMIQSENGLRPRLGYQEWCTGIGDATTEIRTVLPFTSSLLTGNKIFVATTLGIYDCTTSSGAPTRVVTFPTQDANSGYGNYTIFTNSGGNRFMLYCDGSNGYYTYDETGGGTWTQVPSGAGAGQVSNVNPNALVFVLAFKANIWMIEKDTSRAWYLPAGALFGAAVKFEFGTQFAHGGKLAALYRWTLDGGAGADDMLVAVSTSGDVVVYQGTDPASDFNRIGGWFVGGIPTGRRLAIEVGGELALLSYFGLIPISKLVAGKSILQPDIAATKNIRNTFNNLMTTRGSLLGWSCFHSPQDGSMIITYPALAGETHQQFAMSLTSGGWAQYSGLPIVSADAFQGALYFGTADGRLCIHENFIDNVSRTGSLANALPTSWSGITYFTRNGSTRQKQVKMIKPLFITQGANPAVAVQARYNFDVTGSNIAPTPPVVGNNVWDSALWDSGVWGGAQVQYSPIFGGSGVGTHMAIAFAGTSIQRINLIGFDVTYEEGGFL